LRPVEVQSLLSQEGADEVYLGALSGPSQSPVRNFTDMKREVS